MVGAPTGQTRKRKRSTSHDQPVMDVDTWLHKARQANNHEAVQWFTRTILHQETTTTQQRKRPRTLNAQHNSWTTTLTCMEDLARKHPHATTHAYLTATTCAHAMKQHLCDLRSMYDSALRAKRDYHELVDEISLTRIHQRWQQYVAHSQEAYHAAKHHALTSYLDIATAVGLHTRYLHHLHRLRTYGNRRTGYTQHIYNNAGHWNQRLDIQDHAKRTKGDLCSSETVHLRRQQFLRIKRPRENWDPTFWEIPLQLLPKKHKTHWDPIEWEVPCNDKTHTH